MAVVLITGCRSGIGSATALAFARRGDRVYATMREPSLGDRLRDAADRESLSIAIERLDVCNAIEIASVVEAIIAGEGCIDVLVNNAGMPGTIAAIEEIDETVARTTFETNFWGPFRLSRAVLPTMRANGRGVIVNVSSFSVEFPGGPWLAVYGMTKALLSWFSESLQAEVGVAGIRVLAVEPGAFATEIYDHSERVVADRSSPYASQVAAADSAIANLIAEGADPAIAAAAIVAAVQDPHSPTRLVIGDDAVSAVRDYHDDLIERWRPTAKRN